MNDSARAQVRNTLAPFAVIEDVKPQVDGGRFAAKRVVGDDVVVTAAGFAHGHEKVACAVRYRGPGDAQAVVIVNLTPEMRPALRVALPAAGEWHELLNSDAAVYGGSGVGNLGSVRAEAQPLHGWPASALVAVPPLGTVVLSNRPAP